MSRDWLSISQYARLHHTSDMTVRRRIKAGQIQAQLQGGKYYIPAEEPIAAFPEESIPSKSSLDPWQMIREQLEKIQKENQEAYRLRLEASEEKIKVLEEHLRFQKKENNWLHQQIEDLQILVQVLESQGPSNP